MELQVLIKAVQQRLGVKADGFAGPETWKAIYQAVIGEDPATNRAAFEPVDARSESVIAKLQPQVQPYARALVHNAQLAGVDIRVISGFRSYAEQDALFAQGRTKPGRKVTNAKGGESNHNFGIAFDIGIFRGAEYLPESPAYDTVGALGKELGLEWGGDWEGLVDKPHFELRPGWADHLSEREMLAELRRRNTEGTPFYA
jgi:peptidoglycan L-alanyl-D-glutamate endopeptidase CwlK